MTGVLPDDARRTPFSATRVTRVVKQLTAATAVRARQNWLHAVATRVCAQRPDLAATMIEHLGVEPVGEDVLAGLSIGEIGVCYEALLAEIDRDDRRSSGQFFTPDDAAQFMADRARTFPAGTWLDPCSGVGNLSWHLAAAQRDSADFVRRCLVLMDRDVTALISAVALIAADHLRSGDVDGYRALRGRSVRRDALARGEWPDHDYVIVNPPYARHRELSTYRTARTRESFAYFMERVATSARGFVAVTPASYAAAPKFRELRDVLTEEFSGGDVFVFDNVPDTLFRGYKYGSSNTSRTNFVRAAITVCAPRAASWRITPILRWRAASRARMLAQCADLLAPMQAGPDHAWPKLLPGMEEMWRQLMSVERRLSDLCVPRETDFELTVALTPRYYISASYRPLERGSKAVLYFVDAAARDCAALVLNSSLPYLWWRALDGGVTLPRRVLLSVPIPASVDEHVGGALVRQLRESEEASVVTKLNAGRVNENVKRPREIVDALDRVVLPSHTPPPTDLFADDMFPPTAVAPNC